MFSRQIWGESFCRRFENFCFYLHKMHKCRVILVTNYYKIINLSYNVWKIPCEKKMSFTADLKVCKDVSVWRLYPGYWQCMMWMHRKLPYICLIIFIVYYEILINNVVIELIICFMFQNTLCIVKMCYASVFIWKWIKI